jgi:uncharacterized membrane protein
MVNKKHPLAGHVDEDAIAAAIRQAESATDARVVVTLEHHAKGEPLRAAARTFARQNLHRTARRNSVLFSVVPAQRQFAVVGDADLHAKVGQPFWDRLAAKMSETIRSQGLTAGLVEGIGEVGRALAMHFPKSSPR